MWNLIFVHRRRSNHYIDYTFWNFCYGIQELSLTIFLFKEEEIFIHTIHVNTWRYTLWSIWLSLCLIPSFSYLFYNVSDHIYGSPLVLEGAIQLCLLYEVYHLWVRLHNVAMCCGWSTPSTINLILAKPS